MAVCSVTVLSFAASFFHNNSSVLRPQEFLSAMAGPAAGFLLVLLFPWFPRIAFSALVQSLFNLLPIYPFDGGRVIRSIMRNTP